LKDIVHSADLAAQHGRGLNAHELSVADQRRDAALFRIAVIGEAVSHLPAEIQTLAPEVPWNRVRDMRHHIVHGYWQVDFVIVAETISLRLEPLKATVNRLIALLEPRD
jgi:uncharacterized protein with HEPN domain